MNRRSSVIAIIITLALIFSIVPQATYAQNSTNTMTSNNDLYIVTNEDNNANQTTDSAVKVKLLQVNALSIYDARQVNIGTEVKVSGVVSFIDGINYYIQDNNAGIVVRTKHSGIKVGDTLEVEGKTSEYHGLLQIVTEKVTIKQSGTMLEARTVTPGAISESLEGFKVAVKDFKVTNIDKYGNATCEHASERFIILSKKNNHIKPEKDKTYVRVEGVVTYNYGAYKILPSALILKTETPAHSYKVRVKSIVDGDTIHIQPNVLGSHKIRLVNMDTPETYHKVNNEADRLQKKYGDIATQAIKGMLSVDEEITITLDKDSPKDQYGRLLAQIYKSDGTNVNLKMVEEGHAVSYFIWPVQSEKDYQLYQRAVYNAKQAMRGMWAEKDERFELPFVFRARSQGKGLQRYVGNSDTKKYYYPQNYKMVPVEKRIFFKPESQAIEQGYTKDPNQPDPPVDEYIVATIAQARALPINSKVEVTGIVTYKDGKNYYIQDDTGAIVLRSETLKANIGDKVTAKSGTSEYFGLFQIVTDNVKIISTAETVSAKNITVKDMNKSNEAQYVILENLVVIGPDPDDQTDPRNKDKTYILEDTNGDKLFVRTKYQKTPEIGKNFSQITGVVTYSWGKYKLIPITYVEHSQKDVTVSFESNGGSTVEPVTLKEGEVLTKPNNPTRRHYTFKGWFKDSMCTDAYDFSRPVTEDFTLYAKWKDNHLTIEDFFEDLDILADEASLQDKPVKFFFKGLRKLFDLYF